MLNTSSKGTNNSNNNNSLSIKRNTNNNTTTSSSSSSLSSSNNNADSHSPNRIAVVDNKKSPSQQTETAKLLAYKVRRMEIGGIDNNNTATTENTNSMNGNILDSSLNNSNNNNERDNKNDLFEHPPSKKLLTSPQLSSNKAMNESSLTVGADDKTAMDTSTSHNNEVHMASQGPANGIVQTSEDQQQEDESRSECTFQFVLNDFAKFRESKESRLSPACVVRNLPWKMLAMSKQLTNRDFVLGFFLQCNADSDSTRWSIYASAELRLLHVSGDPEKSLVKKIQHLFYSKENDWGFSPFITMKEVMDPEKGFYNSETDSVTLEVWVNADAPHGTAWDSKKLTGFVGLTNQGATCYMNSLLQTLYFTSELRKAVYQLPTETDDHIKSIPLALQRVFYELQFSEKSVGTKKLTRSFGWETFDTFMQHDVQELCRVLLDNLENKMKHTTVEGVIPRLYEGKMISYIKCKTIDYESRRVEPFYDIQLNIKGKKDIYESFKDYVTVETLEGDNKYDAGKYGLQEAQKGVIFEAFPPVLHLHLMRFQYDPHTDSNIKINDRYEFLDEIQLDEFLDKKQSTPALYRLHAVLVHSGDNHGGHYVVFICPKLDGKWFKFDDEVVSRCSRRDAINANFGGAQSDELTFRHSTNAYMLVYVRDANKDYVLSEIGKADIPQQLQERLGEEKRVEALRKKERNEAHLYMLLNIVLEREFYANLGLSDLYDQTKTGSDANAAAASAAANSNIKQLKVKKTSTFLEVMKQIGELLELSLDEMRVWSLMTRYNYTVRPYNCVELKENASKTIVEVSKQEAAWNIFVETTSDLSLSPTFDFGSLSLMKQFELEAEPAKQKLPAYTANEEVMIFFKHYDPRTSSLRYVFHMYISKKSTLNAIQERVNKKMRFPPNTDLLFFEEVRISQIKPILVFDKPLDKLAHEELLTGDIYVFQINEKDKLRANLYDLPLVEDYFNDLMLQVDVWFGDKLVANDEGFSLHLSLKMKYDEFAKMVGEKLEYDPKKIQFFRSATSGLSTATSVTSTTSMLPVKYGPEVTLCEALGINKAQIQQQAQQNQQSAGGQQTRKLFYQKLKLTLSELEERRQFRCLWTSANLKVEREIMFMPLKKSNVKEMLVECRKELLKESLITQEEYDDEKGFKLRLIEIAGHKISRIYKEETPFETLDSTQMSANKMYRVEQILPDELELLSKASGQDGDYLLPVAHFSKEVYATFGAPFLIRVKMGELFKDVKQRIQKRLDVNEKDFAAYRFALVSMGTPNYIPDDENHRLDISNMGGIQPWLGIEHQNKAANKTKSKFSNMEKAIKIFN